MALNWTEFDPSGSPIPLPHEMIISSVDTGAEVILTVPDAPPSATGRAGGSGGSKRLKGMGRVWLTDQRLIFRVASPLGDRDPFQSLQVPLFSILSTEYMQPVFGANYLGMTLKPSPGGGLTEGTKAELRLKDRGMFEFASTVEKTREKAVYMRRQALSDEDDGLPTYTSHAGSTSHTPALPEDGPPGYDDVVS